ncbi:hypothetical protein CPS_1683 [Colwellia psychrerythraea 34H]|uniref:Uncharacterized protein n=1 Tax=Colwellia psychrerythraea (strain 34H / ATCC BAA-681) TaxID=167879 RepID=Q484U4_COLP3|nr:hypothetical protein CPS_1683 [Colwellia psychrerythraea 34H]
MLAKISEARAWPTVFSPALLTRYKSLALEFLCRFTKRLTFNVGTQIPARITIAGKYKLIIESPLIS